MDIDRDAAREAIRRVRAETADTDVWEHASVKVLAWHAEQLLALVETQQAQAAQAPAARIDDIAAYDRLQGSCRETDELYQAACESILLLRTQLAAAQSTAQLADARMNALVEKLIYVYFSLFPDYAYGGPEQALAVIEREFATLRARE